MATRFIKPKIDKYIQLYSKDASLEEVIEYSGELESITVTDEGRWYNDETSAFPPIVTISPPDIAEGGIQATASVLVDETQGWYPISNIIITNKGLGYTKPPTVTITAPTFDGDADDTNDGIVYLWADNAGTGYTSLPTITISPPVHSGGVQATAVAILDEGGLYSANVTNSGSGYDSSVTITVSGGGGSGGTYIPIFYRGFGATAEANIKLIPLPAEKVKKHTWVLDTPIEVNENGLIQVVDRVFQGLAADQLTKPIPIRMYEINTKSIINAKNISGSNHSFYQGKVIDIGLPNRTTPNDIKLEIQPQILDKITLSLNHGIHDKDGFDKDVEFFISLKITEKEPTMLEYGSLNNLNINQV